MAELTEITDSSLHNKLKMWTDSLLDLSRRNPSLNFQSYTKTGKKKPNTFQVGVDPNFLYEKLVLNGSALSLSDLNLIGENNFEDDEILSLFGSSSIYKKFTRLKRDAESIFEERGTHVLYLTIGMFSWIEEKISDERLNTPLLFIPISINKTKTKDRFSIQLSDLGDLELNPTFSYLLKKIHQIDIDEEMQIFINNSEKDPLVSELLSFFEKLFEPLEGTLTPEVWISKFWFEKLVIFTDIQKNMDLYANSQNIKSICGENFTPNIHSKSELEILSKLSESRSPLEIYEVLDTDSSQRVAIEAAINNKNFILIGPPGTGKSQTITNIIAECLARDKKVLFVSEKLAALKVVEKKLSEANLGRFCLSLHGRDSKKKDFYSEVHNWYETLINSVDVNNIPSKLVYEELADSKQKLNEYVSALNAKNNSLGKIIRNIEGDLIQCDLNAQFIQSRLVELHSLNTQSVKTKININEIDEVKYKAQKELLERSIGFKDILLGETESDWFLTSLNGPFTKELQERINETVKKIKHIADIKIISGCILQMLGLEQELKLNNLQDLMLLVRNIIEAPEINESSLNYKLICNMLCDYEEYTKIQILLESEKEKLLGYFKEEFLDLDLEILKKEYTEAFEGDSFKYLKKEYWSERKKIVKFKSRERKDIFFLSDEIIFEELDRAIKINKLRSKLKEIKETLNVKYSVFYGDKLKTLEEVISSVVYVKCIFDLLINVGLNPEEPLPKEIVESLSSVNSKIRSELFKVLDTIYAPLSVFQEGFSELDNYFPIKFNREVLLDRKIEIRSNYFLGKKDIGSYTLNEVESWLLKLSSDLNSVPSLLERWFFFKKIKDKFNQYGLSDFVSDVCTEQKENYENIVDIFEKRVFELIYMDLESKFPALANFDLNDYSKSLEKFKMSDKQSINCNRLRLFSEVSSRIKEVINFESFPEIKLIKKLGNQKYPRMPIRKAINDARNFFLKVKPCWMMSPLSVSQYLPPNSELFDVVIFDEASQVRPSDAIGAIFRSKQVIVVGDPRQLPPTNFFQRITQDEDDLVIDEDSDVFEESIIDEIKAKASNFIEIPLRWHYRSKSEDLFAFSNKYIYGDLNLITFPNPGGFLSDGKEIGVRHILVSDGVYDRGNTRINEAEAEKVADLIVEHFANNSVDKNDSKYQSLGVITFSSAQEKAIIEALYGKKKIFPFVEAILDDKDGESFFIKNLETVQGDERDSIIISVGYGPDKSGKITSNFGPLNQEGGERRLNVAITRAKRNLLMVSSFTHNDIVLNSLQQGPKLLVKYIQFAIEGKKALNIDQVNRKEFYNTYSHFEEMVSRKLKENNIDFDVKVGCSECKIDIGIKNPLLKDSYLFSLECDGPSYYNISSARDRDRLRPNILLDRGWNTHKIWSKEWMRNPELELKKVIEKYNKLVSELSHETKTYNSENGVIEFDPSVGELSA